MSKVLGQVVLAVVLLVSGVACWMAGQLERRVADAHEELALLRYSAVDAEYGDIEQSMGYLRRVPWLADNLMSDVQEHHATAEYWEAHYDTLTPRRDSNGAIVEEPPAELALAANAAYRVGQREAGDRQAMLRRLDGAIKTYTELLKRDPNDVDAAYNYEYVVRLRDTASKAKPVAPSKRDDSKREDPARALQKLTGVVMAGDLPEGRTVHGDPGAPPPATDMTQFKMHIPVRPDERQGGSDAGQGQKKVRKG